MLGVFARVLYALLLAGVLVTAAWISFSRFVHGRSLRVPDLTNLTVDEATSRAAEVGLGVSVDASKADFDDKVAVHHVRGQSPAPAADVKAGQRVRVFLSLGGRTVRVPEMTGMSARTASLALSREELKTGNVSATRVFGPPGVVAQGIEPGTVAAPEAPVDLLVNRGAPDVAYVMPDLIGRDFERVRAAFEARGFRLGGVKGQAYEGAAQGTILRQYPLAGFPVTLRDTLSFVVAEPERSLP